MYRYSGHETFHCREQWLLKGLQLFDNHGDISFFRSNEAINELGVGKNMVRSILHWLKSFGLIDNHEEISKFANLIFLKGVVDPYLEDQDTIWLMQYYLCKTKYASIYHQVFSDYFKDKATFEFTEYSVLNYLKRILLNENQRMVSDKTLLSDIKVFIRTYYVPKKNVKTIEDDFNAPLHGLNLILSTGRTDEHGNAVFKINKNEQESLSEKVLAYSLLEEFDNSSAIDFDSIRSSIGYYFCLTNEGLENKLRKLCQIYHNHFVFKDDAGIKQITTKNISIDFKASLIKD